MAECTCQKDWLLKMFGDPKYSDFTIECGPSTWHVHRVVVCAQSTFFDKACSNGFKETSSKIVKLEDDDPAIVREMLRFLYTGSYLEDFKEVDDGTGHTALGTSMLLHTIADKYDIPALAEAAVAKFSTRAAKEWKTEAFADAIAGLYTSDDSSKKQMRKIAVTVAAEHAKELLDDDGGVAFREVAETVPKFATELSKEIVSIHHKTTPGYTKYRCASPQCNKVNVLETMSFDPCRTLMCSYCERRWTLNAWIARIVKE